MTACSCACAGERQFILYIEFGYYHPIDFILLIKIYIQLLHLFSGPRCLPQELQARVHAGIASETIDGYVSTQLLPSIIIDQELNNGLESFAVQRVVAVLFTHNKGVQFIGAKIGEKWRSS